MKEVGNTEKEMQIKQGMLDVMENLEKSRCVKSNSCLLRKTGTMHN